MLVDNAVVVLESIVRKRESTALDRPSRPHVPGTSEVAMARYGCDAHLGRRVLSDGVHQRHRGPAVSSDQALTVTYALAFCRCSSALTLVPMLAAGRIADEASSTAQPPAGAICARCCIRRRGVFWSRWPRRCAVFSA